MSEPEPELLLRWYFCYRKEALTQRAAATKAGELGLNAFPCEVMSSHWHIGRPPGGASRTRARLRTSAKAQYKKDVERGFLAWRGRRRPLADDAQPLCRRTGHS